MIIHENDSYCRIITQPAHAWLSGQLAEYWGNASFTRYKLWNHLCLAVHNHDAGWLQWENNPILNKTTGRPHDFMTISISDHLDIWKAACRNIDLTSRLAQYLISCHVTNLFNRHNFKNDPDHIKTKAKAFLLNQDTLQKKLLTNMRSDDFYTPYLTDTLLTRYKKLTSVFDYLSLIFCMGNINERVITDVPMGLDQTDLQIKQIYGSKNEFEIHPWPFSQREIDLHCEARYLTEKYNNQSSLVAALEKAEMIVYTVKIIQGRIS